MSQLTNADGASLWLKTVGEHGEPMLFLAVCLTLAALMVFVVQRLLAQSRVAPMSARIPAE